jgi:hypothetical protein
MAQDNRASAINERLFGASKIDDNAAQKGWVIGKDAGQMSSQASPVSFLNTAIDKYKSSKLDRATLDVEQQKARAAGVQRILTEGSMPNAHPNAKKAAEELLKALQDDPMFAQAIGLDPSKTNTSDMSLLFGDGFKPQQGASQDTSQQQDQSGSLLDKIQKNLPSGVSTKVGGFTITGTKVGAAQAKEMGDVAGTSSTIDRVVDQSLIVPDLGGLKPKGFDVVGVLPRGLQGKAREFISKNLTSGEGGGISGLTKEQDENLRSYISNLGTNGGAVYKALSGDSGRLSDFDIERGMNLMWRPDLGETTGVREKKNAILKEAVKKRAKAISQGRYYIDPETGAIMTPEILDEALSGLMASSEQLRSLGLDPDKYELVEE